MIKLLSITSLLCLLFIASPKGKTFSELQGEKLTGEQVSIPKDIGDKVSIVGMAYSKKSEATLKTWYQPMFDKFVLKRGIFDAQYDVNLLFIPMFTGSKKAAYNVSMKQMKESNREDLYPYLLFYKGDLEPYVSELEMDNKELPYLFILDENGSILYSTKGLFNEKKMEEIEAVLDARL